MSVLPQIANKTLCKNAVNGRADADFFVPRQNTDTDFHKSYFSARKIIYASTANKIYTLEVACHIIRKICIHLFKIGETVTIENDGTVSLQVGLAFNAKATVLVWYTVAAGETVTIKPDLMGSLDFKYVIVKNADLYVKGHLVFTINKSK